MDSLYPLDHPGTSLCFLGEAFSLLVPFVNHDKKGENLWRICGFFFKILHTKGRNTCLCKGEMCFILLGGVLTSFFLYTGLVTIFIYIVFIFDIYMMMYVFFTYLYMCCFFSIFIHMFLIFVCNLLFLFHTKMPWWVLFKVFQKYRLSKFTCHKLSSCKVFQEFLLG